MQDKCKLKNKLAPTEVRCRICEITAAQSLLYLYPMFLIGLMADK